MGGLRLLSGPAFTVEDDLAPTTGGCAAGAGRAAGWWWLALLGLVARRRGPRAD